MPGVDRATAPDSSREVRLGADRRQTWPCRREQAAREPDFVALSASPNLRRTLPETLRNPCGALAGGATIRHVRNLRMLRGVSTIVASLSAIRRDAKRSGTRRSGIAEGIE